MLGTESGTLASQSYPGTYPSNTWCKWRLRMAEGRTLRLLFGDFDIESSPGCSNGSLVITDINGEQSLGKLVQKLSCVSSIYSLLEYLLINFMCPVITDVSSAKTVEYTQDAIPLTHWLKRQSQFHNQHMHIFQPEIFILCLEGINNWQHTKMRLSEDGNIVLGCICVYYQIPQSWLITFFIVSDEEVFLHVDFPRDSLSVGMRYEHGRKPTAVLDGLK